MDKLARLKRGLDTLHDARQALYARTNGLSQAEIEFKPAPDSWSIGEVMDHIIKAESYFIGELRKKVLTFGDEAEVDNLLSQVLRPFIFAGMRYGSSLVKFEAPQPIQPVHGFPHLYLVYKLGQVRDATIDVAERLARREEPVYVHDPRIGAVYSGEDWLYLTGLHERRHVGQVERVLGKIAEAKNSGEFDRPRLGGGTRASEQPAEQMEEVVL